MNTNVIRYTTKNPHAAADNRRLVENVFAELEAADPGGLRYAAFRLADGVTFVHVVVHESDDRPLGDLPAFRQFQARLDERLDGQPSFNDATLVGAYRFFGVRSENDER